MSTNDQRMYDSIVSAVKSLVPNYGIDNEAKALEFIVAGDPFNVLIDIKFLEESGCYMFFSELGFTVPEANRLAYASEICRINFDQLAIGSFDFNMDDGTTCYRLGQIYEDSLISEDTIKTTFRLVYDTVCKFNERLFNASRSDNTVNDNDTDNTTVDDTVTVSLTPDNTASDTEGEVLSTD